MIYKKLQENFEKNLENNLVLYRSSVTGRKLWELYLKGFGADPVYRDPASSVHRCNCCQNFIERYGNIVAVDLETYEIKCLWEMGLDSEEQAEYGESFRLMTEALKGAPIGGVFTETYEFLNATPYERCKKDQQVYRLGYEKNLKMYTEEEAKKFGVVKPGQVVEYRHWSLAVQKKFISFSGTSAASIEAKARDSKETLGKLMGISLETYELVADLIDQDSILNGKTYQASLKTITDLRREFPEDTSRQDIWLWIQSGDLRAISLWGSALGELIKKIQAGEDLEAACRTYNSFVDPANYMKAKKPITQRQIDEAKKFIQEHGYTESFERRLATLADIKSEDVKYLGSSGKGVQAISILDKLTPGTPSSGSGPIDKTKLPEIGIEKFMSDILPGSKDVQVYFESRLEKNLMNLTTATDRDKKKIFKWPNNYSWTYNGGLAGKSMIKEVVKAAGGFVDAPLRCSLIWNESGDAIHTDLDIHCEELTVHDHVFYGNHHIRKNMSMLQGSLSKGGGVLDLDITDPASQCGSGVAAENIFYPDLKRVKDGLYRFYAFNFNGGGNTGAKAEIFFDGAVFQYTIPTTLIHGTQYMLATVMVEKGTLKDIEQSQYFTGSSNYKTTIWSLRTLEFHPVSMICLSPNYWSEPGVGNKHYFLFIDKAVCPDKIKTFHTENLSPELVPHRKVIEALSGMTTVEATPGALTGLGFNATVREDLIIKVDGKLYNLKF